MYFEQRTIAGNFNEGTYPDNLYTDEDNCEVIKNYHRMNKNAKEVFDSLLQYNIERSERYAPEFKLWLIIGLIVILFVTFLPINADILVYRKMVNEFCKILLNLPPKHKEEAKNPLMDDIAIDSSNTGAVAKKVAQYKLIVIILVTYILIFLLFASYIALCVTMMKSTENSSMLLKWYFYSVERMVLAKRNR
ncbi:hypothetical protein TVAG_158530 [Trichomonas vaginalis G3]|uniref:Uncharacterized protein n=1 Tax=Trichomonas vaginalis (strain ATCC PRA-98 / G3) TaxID=412133 RepID=A2E6N6_TRIV3|nr:guanylate cyclase protein [Trichomonas vaginalis G3]EAY11630.1 hypothetical protein TVAG_158530 [Trichomonas vaginalis G3]KAI5494965.1 guanylate cyclase protein [Trichomonas vaginalis G3]|eukprot:XP_001323853.1 hypothetical protein [Trichomonas vaginalis G3]